MIIQIPYVGGILKHKIYKWPHFRHLLTDLLSPEDKISDNTAHIRAGADWLVNAHYLAPDGGISRGYYFSKGWTPSHVGCAGYASESLYNLYQYTCNQEHKLVAEKVTKWLILRQHDSGAYPKSQMRDKEPRVLSTAEAMFGLLRAIEENRDKSILQAAERAGNWLLSVQDRDGAWRKFNYSHTSNEFTYHAKTAFALYRLYEITNDERYRTSAIDACNWVLTQQRANGYFNRASMNGDRDPQTHLIAYILRGLIEVGIRERNAKYIKAVELAAKGLEMAYERYGFIPATLNKHWGSFNDFYKTHAKTSCLCGDAEIAIIMKLLYLYTGREGYNTFSKKLTTKLKSFQSMRYNDLCFFGGLKGSSRVWGRFYEQFAYVNWSIKFLIDALLLEEEIEGAR